MYTVIRLMYKMPYLFNITQADMREEQHDCCLQQHHGEKQTTEVKIKQEGYCDAELGGEKTIEGGGFVLILSYFI